MLFLPVPGHFLLCILVLVFVLLPAPVLVSSSFSLSCPSFPVSTLAVVCVHFVFLLMFLPLFSVLSFSLVVTFSSALLFSVTVLVFALVCVLALNILLSLFLVVVLSSQVLFLCMPVSVIVLFGPLLLVDVRLRAVFRQFAQ